MSVDISEVEVREIITRTGGYLRGIATHSVQPYRGCTFGGSLCGVGCYVRANPWVTRGRPWGGFLEVRTNAAEAWRRGAARERRWCERRGDRFGVFLSSATDPFVPQERRYGVTRSLLEAMVEEPPDELIVQTHGDGVLDVRDLLRALDERLRLRVHVSVESDRARLPGLPPPACSVERRFAAAAALTADGFCTVITVAPLLPIDDAEGFFSRCADVAHAVVIDHFIGGDGTADGRRTRATALPDAMERVLPGSSSIEYRERVIGVARRHLPGRVGVGAEGFAGCWT